MAERGAEIWQQILNILDEKLQYGFLEQAKLVVQAELDGSTLRLAVASDDAYQFFSSTVNQQRLLIISRPVVSLSNVVVMKALPGGKAP